MWNLNREKKNKHEGEEEKRERCQITGRDKPWSGPNDYGDAKGNPLQESPGLPDSQKGKGR